MLAAGVPQGEQVIDLPTSQEVQIQAALIKMPAPRLGLRKHCLEQLMTPLATKKIGLLLGAFVIESRRNGHAFNPERHEKVKQCRSAFRGFIPKKSGIGRNAITFGNQTPDSLPQPDQTPLCD